jgi:quinol monooxygenase YgiN
MNVMHEALIAATVLAAAAVPGALAQAADNQAAYAVTYFEVAPSAETEAANLLRRAAAASGEEAGKLRYDILQHIERRSQFAILEAWSDAKALEAHGATAAMKQFRDQLSPLRVGFYDQRLDTGIDVVPVAAPALSAPAGGSLATEDAIHVITHVDVTGQFKDEAIVMMKKLAADSRREPGAARFEVWQQNNRLNHFTVVEVWKDQAALDAHNLAAGTREFREKLGGMMGALYDDRRYRTLK